MLFSGIEVHVVNRPAGTNPFEFIVVASLRAAQLMRGCTPLVEPGSRVITTAQLEVAAGKVARVPAVLPIVIPATE
jgi:DNA-directed RNA polymerase subunit K/omega